MRVFYFNDAKHSVSVFVGGLGKDHYDGDLRPTEGRVFDVPVKDDQILWIKSWGDYVMLSSADKAAFEEVP